MRGSLKWPPGILGTGVLWAVGWAGLDSLFFLLSTALGARVELEPGGLLLVVFGAGVLGFAAGSGFGVVLTLLEYHDRLDDLPVKWIALGGGIAGLAILAVVGTAHWGAVVALTILVTGSAVGTVALAKKGRTERVDRGR